jgi:hypothetical protein
MYRFTSTLAVLLFAAACSDVQNSVQPLSTGSASQGGSTPTTTVNTTTPAPAPSGGTQLPPSPRVDGPAWWFSQVGSIAGPFTANINFDAMQNQSPGGISVGSTRTGLELVYNVSKKTPLIITNITFTGANPGDFSIPAADLASALSTVLPANKGAAEMLHVVFSPTAAGPRSATLQVTSAAGIAQNFLTGTGLVQQPVLAPIPPLNFIPTSAAINLTITNTGGQTLVLNSIGIVGGGANAFAIVVTNHGLSNCFAGMPLAPKASCLMAVGLAPGATPPASASLEFLTNDPINPKTDVALTFTP